MGDREIPNHPLVKQTIDDCLTEAMDIDGLEEVLRKIEHDEIRCIARGLPEPSPLAAEILNARPYAFLDNAPLEERRTQAVYTRRASEKNGSDGLGVLDAAAIDKVNTEAWPSATNADELHDALMLIGAMTEEEMHRTASETPEEFFSTLVAENRATQVPLECGAPATGGPLSRRDQDAVRKAAGRTHARPTSRWQGVWHCAAPTRWGPAARRSGPSASGGRRR